MSDHPICHVAIPAADPTALSTFYREVFDWQTEAAEQSGTSHLFHVQRGPGGAFVQAGEETDTQPGHVLIYIFTEDIDDTLKKAEELGATTVTPKTEIPPYGWTAVFVDPAGNRIALFSTPQA
jgi:predicted enzyme related to lactoylglutathione lyase